MHTKLHLVHEKQILKYVAPIAANFKTLARKFPAGSIRKEEPGVWTTDPMWLDRLFVTYVTKKGNKLHVHIIFGGHYHSAGDKLLFCAYQPWDGKRVTNLLLTINTIEPWGPDGIYDCMENRRSALSGNDVLAIFEMLKPHLKEITQQAA